MDECFLLFLDEDFFPLKLNRPRQMWGGKSAVLKKWETKMSLPLRIDKTQELQSIEWEQFLAS